MENKFLENKSGRIFCVRQVYKFLPINLGACKPIFYLFIFFIHHIWGERVPRGAVFILQTSYKMQYFTIFQDKLLSFNIQDHRSTHGLLINETVQKISKITFTASRFQILTSAKFAKKFLELRFNVIKNLLTLFFIHGFITMFNHKERLIGSAFWVLLQAMFMNGWKQTAKRWKLHFWDYEQSIKKYNSVEHLQRQQFSFTKTNEYLSVSKNPKSLLVSWRLSLCFKPPVSRCLLFSKMNSEQENRSKLSFYSQNYK